MGDAKQLIVKPISSSDANRIIRQLHYSGKVVNNSQLHLGVFMDGKCGGAMQFGPSLDKRKMLGLVTGTLWNEFLELNRMAFADWLPRNGESRCIGYAMRWIKKTYQHIKWVVSFSDGTQCGDGTIYRASGFLLTGVQVNKSIWIFPDGETVADLGIKTGYEWQRKKFGRVLLATEALHEAKRLGGKPIKGFQLRYIYFIDPTARDRLTVPVLPFSEIERCGACMYKGKAYNKTNAPEASSDAPVIHTGEGGAAPTSALT